MHRSNEIYLLLLTTMTNFKCFTLHFVLLINNTKNKTNQNTKNRMKIEKVLNPTTKKGDPRPLMQLDT